MIERASGRSREGPLMATQRKSVLAFPSHACLPRHLLGSKTHVRVPRILFARPRWRVLRAPVKLDDTPPVTVAPGRGRC